MANTLLQVTGLEVAYGAINAVKGVDFEVQEGELVSLIGSNGAGKTTTMKAITALLPIKNGDILFLGKSIKGRGAWDLVKEGLVMIPEGRGVFTRMTITENLQMGAFIRNDKARGLMSQPKVLLLDEPSMGLSPIMVDKIFEVVEDVHKQGVTMLLVEQNASRALSIADRGYVMESGLVTMTGEARQMLSDPKVRAAYLGE